jgi:DNA-binding protein H-NS
MSKYREFQAELERLHQQSETARRREKAEALARIRALIDEYALDASDLGIAPDGKLATPAAPKYRDPATGATWSGRGRPPRWLVGQDRSGFAI